MRCRPPHGEAGVAVRFRTRHHVVTSCLSLCVGLGVWRVSQGIRHYVTEMGVILKAPFPWFGGKRKVADIVWRRFGDVGNYVEPFAGSLAVLLERPTDHQRRTETVNDFDGYVANFWRCLSLGKDDEVARWADWPVNENDLHARHWWLLQRRETLRPQLEADPDWCDPKIAGWWVWGQCAWIGSGFCSGNGPWHAVDMEDGTTQLVSTGEAGGTTRQLIHLGNSGQGINRQRNDTGIYDYMAELADRLRGVRVASGDWSRVCGPSPTTKLGLTGVFLDPPYADEAERDMRIYTEDSGTVAHDVREWALSVGDDPNMRIALCGYGHEHGPYMPDSWECVAWNAGAGFAGQRRNGTNDNGKAERIWFSPHCLKPERNLSLFDFMPAIAGA